MVALTKRAAISALLALSIIGVATLAYGTTIPEWSDAAAASNLQAIPELSENDNARCVVNDFYERTAELRTSRWVFIGGGGAVALFAVTMAALVAAFSERTPDSWGLATPRRRWVFLALGVVAIVNFWFGFATSLSLDLERGEFPWCSDTIAIPLAGIGIASILAFLFCLPVGFAITRPFAPLPQPVAAWPKGRPWLNWTLSIVCLISILIGVLAIVVARTDFLAVPAYVLFGYLLLATRAAIVARFCAVADSATPR